ncbi:MAG: hypothetical protein K6G76_06705 [Lachnospiraceae bacterium]|nr:hypothetical protein [Lachnospiraceae bacterium]
MDYLFKAIHKIDYDAERFSEVEIHSHFDEFVSDLLEKINSDVVNKAYVPISQSTQVVNDIRSIFSLIEVERVESEELEKRVKEYSRDIAQRLFEKEKLKQEQIYRMGQNVKKGSLIQAAIKKEDSYAYLLAKVEHSSFVDDSDFSFKSGFSSEQKKIWKTCIFNCCIEDEKIIVNEAKIYVSNSGKYWANDFLELRELSTDAQNTKNAFSAIERVLIKEVKKKSPSDYTVIRNTFVGYMKKEQQVDYNEMVSSILDDYHADYLTQESITELKGKLMELPENGKFDRLFKVVPAEIRTKIKQLYRVNEGIEIKVNDYVQDIKQKISAEEDLRTGQKFIRIMTNNDDVYKQFK